MEKKKTTTYRFRGPSPSAEFGMTNGGFVKHGQTAEFTDEDAKRCRKVYPGSLLDPDQPFIDAGDGVIAINVGDSTDPYDVFEKGVRRLAKLCNVDGRKIPAVLKASGLKKPAGE